MNAQAIADGRAVDWQAMREQIRAKLKGDYKTKFRMSLAVLVAEAPAIWMMTADETKTGVRALVAVWAFLIFILSFATISREMRIDEESKMDLLRSYRGQLEKGVRVLRFVWVLPPFVLVALAMANGPHPPLYWMGAGWLACFVLGLVAYVSLVRLPHLQRELDLLKRQ